MRTVVILGTGTNVGKTYATCTIAGEISGHLADSSILAIKPIETGVDCLETTDAARLGLASVPKTAAEHAYAFKPALSPHLAAKMSGIVISVGHTVEWIHGRCRRSGFGYDCSKGTQWALIETAGGVFSPINEAMTNLDLAIALEPSTWVLVAPDRLGVLHDVRSTLLAMSGLSRTPDIIVLNATQQPDTSSGTNRRELEALGWANVTGRIEHNGGFEESDRKRLAEKLGCT
jgi:dethiobiotin synthetase